MRFLLTSYAFIVNTPCVYCQHSMRLLSTLHAFVVSLTCVFRALQDLTLTNANLTQPQGISVTNFTNLTQVSKILISKSLRIIHRAIPQMFYFVRIKVLNCACLLICTAHKGFGWFFPAISVKTICNVENYIFAE